MTETTRAKFFCFVNDENDDSYRRSGKWIDAVYPAQAAEKFGLTLSAGVHEIFVINVIDGRAFRYEIRVGLTMVPQPVVDFE